MDERRSLLTHLSEAIDRYRAERRDAPSERQAPTQRRWPHWLGRQMIPNIGTLILVAVLLVTVPSLAAPKGAPEATSTSTISYQGRLADAAGAPITGPKNMIFRIYESPVSGSPLWQEDWVGANHVEVSDGLFNVMLGSLNPSLYDSIQGHDELYLGIEVEYDGEMEPRVQLGSVPFSMEAMTVRDGSITTTKISDAAVSTEKIADGAVTPEKLAGYGPGLIQSWSGPDTAFPADGPSQPRVTFDTGIDVVVPEGTTQYYLVTYEGILGYWGWARIDPEWFHSAWNAQLVDGATQLAKSELPGVGYRMKWDNFSNDWSAMFWTSWMVELGPGTHSLDITIAGYSDGTMSEAFINWQKVHAFPLR